MTTPTKLEEELRAIVATIKFNSPNATSQRALEAIADQLLDTIDALRKERDEAWHEYGLIYGNYNQLSLQFGLAESRAETAEALVAKMREGLGSPASLSIGDGIVTAAYARDEDACALFNILSWTPDAKEPRH